MTADEEQSLSDQHTFHGDPGGNDDSPQSLGDQATLGDTSYGGEAVFDDGIQVTDLDDRYITEGVLGKGGMGEVLLATDKRLNRKVAIKRILGDAAKSRTAVSRFLTEAQSIAALNHPNIVQIYDYGRAADGPFLIMEYVEGSSLLDKCREGALELEEAVDLTCQLCDGLAKAHDANIIHRDIKPANVLLTPDGVPKLTDFGLAKDETADSGLSVAGAVLGTLDFMPPEQRKDVTLTDARSDLWSLAATLYQMVTGKSPKIIKFNDVPKSLHDVLGKALEDKKDDRYQAVQDFRDALRTALQSGSPTDLGEGECPNCGTENQSTRKFCRSCAGSLEADCLSCSSGMPVWENVCGSCGTKQDQLIDKRQSDQQEIRDTAEAKLRIGDFEAAADFARKLADESDVRLHGHKAWAENFLGELDGRKAELKAEAERRLEEAESHFKAHDYESALKTVNQIPEEIADFRQSELKQRAEQCLDEVNQLSGEIRKRVKSHALEGVSELVDRYLELKPEAENFRQLKGTLGRRSAKLEAAQNAAFTQAKTLFDSGDDEKCVAYIASLSADQQNAAIADLKEKSASRSKRRRQLRKQIQRQFKSKEYGGLNELCDEYLEISPNDTEIRKLQQQLEKRSAKLDEQVAQVWEKVEQLQTTGDFEEAIGLLQKIPDDRWDDEASRLHDDLIMLSDSRSRVLKKLNESSSLVDLEKAIVAAKKYQTDLVAKTSGDEPLMTSITQAKEQIEALRTEAAAAERRRRIMKGLYVATACVFAIGAAAAFFWYQHQQKLTETIADARNRAQEAVAQSDFPAAVTAFDELLELLPSDPQGLLGRASAKLQLDEPAIESATTDISAAESAGAEKTVLNTVKTLLFCCQAELFSAGGDLQQTQEKLQSLRDLNASKDLITRAEQAVGNGLLKESLDLAAKFQPEEALDSLKRAGDFPVDPVAATAGAVQVGKAFINKARTQIGLKEYEEALSHLEQARSLDGTNPDINSVSARLYVGRAQAALAANDRDTASADFLLARKLDSTAQGLGYLAAQLADGLVQRCETEFSDAPYQEATAALATVIEVDASNAAQDLKDRLGKVLLVEADKALAAKDVDRTAGLAESIAQLNVLPAEQNRLLTAAAGLLFEQCQQQIRDKQLEPAVTSLLQIQNMPVDDSRKQQAITALVSQLEPVLLTNLQSPAPESAIAVLQQLPESLEYSISFRESISALPNELLSFIPLALQERWDSDVVLFLDFDRLDESKRRPLNLVDKSLVGTPPITVNDGKRDNALVCAGQLSTIDLPRTNLPLGNAPRTVACWLKLKKDTQLEQLPFVYGTIESEDAFYIIADHRNGKPCIGNPGGAREPLVDTNIVDDQWHHVALVHDGTHTRLFTDGIEKLSYRKTYRTSWSDYGRNLEQRARIGEHCNGMIDDFVIVKRALTAAEINRLMSDGASALKSRSTPESAATPPPDAPSWLNDGLVAYYPLKGNGKEASGNAPDGHSATAHPDTGRFGDSADAISFKDAAAILVPNHQPLGLTAPADFTISFWAQKHGMYPYTFPLNKSDGPGPANKWTVNLGQYENGQRQPNTPYLGFHWQVNSKPQWALSDPIGWDDSWHQYVITRKKDLFHFFMDAESIGAFRNAAPLTETSGPLRIGKSAENEPPFDGALSDVRFYNRALLADDVKQLYEYESQPPGQPSGQGPSPAIAPFDRAQATTHQQAWANHLGVPVETTNSVGMQFKLLPGGVFTMGERGAPHQVTLTKGFELGVYEVTQEQYEQVMGTNPSKFKGSQNPVEEVSWNDAVEFCRKLSEMPAEKKAGYVYRLPTEAEWEYACRAGTTTAYSFGDSESDLGDYAWYAKNSGNTTHPVGQKNPNAWGLYDMHGNLWEWCQDWYGAYPSGSVTDPTGPSSGSRRVVRGGGWYDYYDNSDYCRSAYRTGLTPDDRDDYYGFRVLRSSVK